LVGSSSSSRFGRFQASRASAQRRLLAAGHRSDRAGGHLGAEAELAEEVAQLLLARLRVGFQGDPAQMLQRRLVRAQLVELVLAK